MDTYKIFIQKHLFPTSHNDNKQTYLREEFNVLRHCELIKEHIVLRTDTNRPPHLRHLTHDVVTVDQRTAAAGREQT